jgi:hypothetical protein
VSLVLISLHGSLVKWRSHIYIYIYMVLANPTYVRPTSWCVLGQCFQQGPLDGWGVRVQPLPRGHRQRLLSGTGQNQCCSGMQVVLRISRAWVCVHCGHHNLMF